ncbi:hypothetical protein QZH41_015482 [Actinostola sp. cb2023]|nr:hypothetical protein QZH41_015482 [Actinostola sp. cb2023]
MSKEKAHCELPCKMRSLVLCEGDLDEVIKHATGRKVLIPVDGSDYSMAAFNFYLDNIHHSDDIVILTHTLELPPKPSVPFPDVGKHYEEWRKVVEEHRCKSRSILGNFLERLENQKGKEQKSKSVAIHDEHSSPGEGIVAISKDYHVTLIIIGSRGHGLIRRSFLGSVSDYVIHHSHVPIAVVPPST